MKNNWIIDREYLEDEFGVYEEEVQDGILSEIQNMDMGMHDLHDYIDTHLDEFYRDYKKNI